MQATEVSLSEQIDTLAREYSTNFRGMRKQMVRFRTAICPFDDVFRHAPFEGTGFDIGCGAGFTLFAQAKLRRARSLVGVDVDRKLANHTTGILRNLVPTTSFDILTTDSHRDWPAQTFDLVTLIDVLHHIPVEGQIEFVRAAAFRVARGGTLIYKDMSAKPFLYGAANRLHDLVLARQWINYISIDVIASTLAELGFVQVARDDRKMFWYSHQLLVMKLPN